MEIHIPTPLRAYTDKLETVTVDGTTVAEGLASLVAAHPAMRQHLFTTEGKLRSFVNVYLNDDDVRYLPAKEDSPVAPTDELTIIPSIAGGAPSIASCAASRCCSR
jgi:molybdopterin synthase sulfur carrier subunit